MAITARWGRREEEGAVPTLISTLACRWALLMVCCQGRRGSAARNVRACSSSSQSARRTSGEKEGIWQEKVPLIVEEGTGECNSSAHPLTSHSHTLSVVFAHGSLALYLLMPETSQSTPTLAPHTPTLIPPAPTLTPPTPTLTPPTLTPPTHVHVHSQYTVGGTVLVQLVSTSHFGLQVEPEVVRMPEDKSVDSHTHSQ